MVGPFPFHKNGITLNPGHGVLKSQGMDEVDKAIEAWERALGALQAENLTAAEKKQRDQYNSKVAAAKAKSESLKAEPKKPEGMMRVRSSEREKLPWERAIAIIPELFASQTWNSSVRRFTHIILSMSC